MCTLVVDFCPQSIVPLVICANRDENPSRPSEPWKMRSGIYSPLDVRGGTWIGINDSGVFCAITNWDIPEKEGLHGMQSRGDIVLQTLKCRDEEEIDDYWSSLKAEDHKPFNILAATKNSLKNLSCNNTVMELKNLTVGLHISTGDGFNTDTKRVLYVKSQFEEVTPFHRDRMKEVMSYHVEEKFSEDAVCVHDEKHEWETRSSSIIVMHANKWWVEHVDKPPCEATKSDWKNEMVQII